MRAIYRYLLYSIGIAVALILIALLINGFSQELNVTNEVSPVLKKPAIDPKNYIDYIGAYISPDQYFTKIEYQPLTAEIKCQNSVETVNASYKDARLQLNGVNKSPLSCNDVLRNNICPNESYFDDPDLKSILGEVSPYLTKNAITENDLRMARLYLQFKRERKNNPSKYRANYNNPRIAYLIMSANKPSFLVHAFKHIRENAEENTIIYTTFDHNSQSLQEFNQLMKSYPDIHVLSTPWYGNWGGISLVYIEVNAWLDLLGMSNWDYLINLSESDGFIVPANIIAERVKELNGRSILDCPYKSRYPNDQNATCIIADTQKRYKKVWVDCGSSVRAIDHPNFSPNYPSFVNFAHKMSQWKIVSRTVLEALVDSQDFWDILFSYRNSYVPDEHVFLHAVSRVLPHEHLLFHTKHKKIDINKVDVIVSDKEVSTAIEQGYWFIRKIHRECEWESVARVRSQHFGSESPPKRHQPSYYPSQ